jgi:hypothetical protein
VTASFANIQANIKEYERLDTADCIKEYGNSFSSTRRNVVAVSSTLHAEYSVLDWGYSTISSGVGTNFWICSVDDEGGPSISCNPNRDVLPFASNWTIHGNPIDYCLSELVADQCYLQYSLKIALALIVFSLIKVVSMLFILFKIDSENLLPSLGDAVSSFLRDPDPQTIGMCFATRSAAKSMRNERGYARLYQPLQARWYQALSRKRFILSYIV